MYLVIPAELERFIYAFCIGRSDQDGPTETVVDRVPMSTQVCTVVLEVAVEGACAQDVSGHREVPSPAELKP